MIYPILQAHRGVSSECPENSMSAFIYAANQGFGAIELDPAVTADGVAVLLHDQTLNRTARNLDGSIIDKPVEISNITYAEALNYDIGISLSKKFAGERIPKLSDVLSLAEKHNILIKIDNKFERMFNDAQRQVLFDTVRASCARVAFTVISLNAAKLAISQIPDCEIHYDGALTEDTVKELAGAVPREKLVFWIPIENKLTDWVKLAYATEESCAMIKKYGRLGVWNLSEYSEYEKAMRLGADIVETNGELKPIMRAGILPDLHIHSKNSHDSVCPLSASAEAAKQKGIDIISAADHADIEFYDTVDVFKIAESEKSDIDRLEKSASQTVLFGIELGEGHWHPEISEKLSKQYSFDLIIGSVHAVNYKELKIPYSRIDFSKLPRKEVEEYLSCYFDDVLKMINSCDIDILAHLTCPLRYINGKYNLGIDAHMYSNKISEVLSAIIKNKKALEVNTSCLGEGYNEFMPEEWIISLYKKMGGHLITLGSDAHTAEKVGHEFDSAIKMLKRNGFNYICYFKERKIYQCTLGVNE